MMRSILTAAALSAFAAPAAHATDFTVTQHDNKFSMPELRVKVGDSVSFRNDDPHFHNIFSLSDTHSFDLGSYPKGEARTVKFDKEGEVDVECAIHPSMKMKVLVGKK
jgi:plastocyanin